MARSALWADAGWKPAPLGMGARGRQDGILPHWALRDGGLAHSLVRSAGDGALALFDFLAFQDEFAAGG